MLNVMSAALSGLSASAMRLEAVANNIANKDSRGGLPSAGAEIAQQPYKPVQVESASLASGGVSAGLRSTTPAYLAVYDPQASYADGQGLAGAPNVDPLRETTNGIEASASFKANAKTVQAIDDLVRKLYDLV